MHYLYVKTQEGEAGTRETGNGFPESCTVQALRPNPVHLCLPGERPGMKKLLGRVYFWLITRGKYRIFYLLHGIEVVHTAYVIPGCSKFPFLRQGEYEIGPCATNPRYRRKGSYCYMLNHITALPEYTGNRFYMIVSDTNEASIKGIEKAGFSRCGTVVKTGLLKKYVNGE